MIVPWKKAAANQYLRFRLSAVLTFRVAIRGKFSLAWKSGGQSVSAIPVVGGNDVSGGHLREIFDRVEIRWPISIYGSDVQSKDVKMLQTANHSTYPESQHVFHLK